jgi:hypothetical protein
MAWVRIHDGAMSHPKILGLSDRAFRVWVRGLSYCQMHLTDGVIPRAAAGVIGATVKSATELNAARLWTQMGDGWCVHDYLDWNDAKDTIQNKRDVGRQRWQRWKDKGTNAVANGVANGEVATRPPHRGVGNTEDQDLSLREEEAPAFVAFWDAYPRKVGKPAALKAWGRIARADALLDAMLDAIRAQQRSAQWTKDGGEFIPHPATWLNQRRWEDVPPVVTGPRSLSRPEWECPHQEPKCTARGPCHTRQIIDAGRQEQTA